MNYREFLEHRGIDTYDGAGQSDFLVTCPFHDDTSPSLEVHKRKGIFYCFGCKEHGSFAELLAEIENISLTDARRMVLTEDDVSSVLSDLKEALDELDDEPAKLKMYSIRSFRERYPSVLDVPEACDYVAGRGISEV